MKSLDFDFSSEFKFDFENGIASFKNTRLVLFDVDAIGLLRHNLVTEFGTEKAREIFLRFGYQQGYSDFMMLKANYNFENEMELLAAGPAIHTWEGITKAIPIDLKMNRETGEFHFTGSWKNSYEAEQHINYFGISNEPTCWNLMGYASGYATAFWGKKLICIETKCTGKGDDENIWLIKPENEWGAEAKPYIEALKKFNQ